MRRGLAAVILGISLLIGSIAWGGFVLSRTILDPERSERLAAQLFDNVELRAALTDRLADGFERTLPPEVGVDRSSIDAAAAVALDDPRVQELIRDGLVQAHQNALNGETGDTTLDVTALGAALLAGLAVGCWDDLADVAAVWQTDRVFTPSMPRAEVARRRERWQEAVRRSLNWTTS